ncbi:MAG: hypothetical protein KC445_10630 [Anaerolineales bacterium]|nr:hypothetical protein [Anaerolineales bacterium]
MIFIKDGDDILLVGCLNKGAGMLNELHNHIVNELGQSSRTDTIFVVTAVVFNLIVLGVYDPSRFYRPWPRIE